MQIFPDASSRPSRRVPKSCVFVAEKRRLLASSGKICINPKRTRFPSRRASMEAPAYRRQTPPAAVSRVSAGAAASDGTGPGTRKGARERASGPHRLGNQRLPSDARCDGSDSALALFFFELVVEVAADEVHEILSDFRGLFIAQPDEAYGRDQRRIKR